MGETKQLEAVTGFNWGPADTRVEAGEKIDAGSLPTQVEKDLLKAGVLNAVRRRGGGR